MVPVIYLFYPETADRSLEDVEHFFRENHDVFVFRHKDATSVKRPQGYGLDIEGSVRESEIRKGEEHRLEVQHIEKFS